MNPDPAADLARRVAAAYAALPGVEAVALGGSRATGVAEAGSDIDLYVYSHEPLAVVDRARIAAGFSSQPEVGNAFWEPGDEWRDAATGLHVDVMFRTTGWIEDALRRVLDRHEASVGYSTCIWHNVRTAKPLADRRGWFAALQAEAHRPYPDALARAIVAKNHPILRGSASSFAYQLASAWARGDRVSVNHRAAAFLAGYFDVLFAANRQPHPGEKRLVAHAERACPDRPPHLRADIDALLAAACGPDDPAPATDRLVDGLDAVLNRLGLLAPAR